MARRRRKCFYAHLASGWCGTQVVFLVASIPTNLTLKPHAVFGFCTVENFTVSRFDLYAVICSLSQ
jgi:hypothetical protein